MPMLISSRRIQSVQLQTTDTATANEATPVTPAQSNDSPRSRRQILGYVSASAAATAGGVIAYSATQKEDRDLLGSYDGVTRVRPGESIQKAIDRAVPGTMIALEPGDYDERLEISTTGITLSGSGRHFTRLINAGGDLITLNPAKGVSGVVFQDLTLKSRKGAEHLLNVPYGLNQSVFQRVRMIQTNDSKSLDCVREKRRGGLFDNRFTGCYFRMPTMFTVPGFQRLLSGLATRRRRTCGTTAGQKVAERT